MISSSTGGGLCWGETAVVVLMMEVERAAEVEETTTNDEERSTKNVAEEIKSNRFPLLAFLDADDVLTSVNFPASLDFVSFCSSCR
jgi:hypothetical protein